MVILIPDQVSSGGCLGFGDDDDHLYDDDDDDDADDFRWLSWVWWQNFTKPSWSSIE